ncbi:AfsR/SARP family transcriptional regulator [Streptomyces sp. Tu 3180]|uniref:AfsR/SARP family transcriptional regulator n=1 Tax=Streptomyces sp. Tu 3180 TaxID=2682611 RepID=UPI001AA04E3B|nr:AfsR/SARP family transcriptional regulator [Streptomyces sp. Tu 3180]
MLRFNILGPLALTWNTETITVPRGPKVRQLLSLLVLQPGAVVSHGTLVDELWGKEPPKTALSTVRTHVYHLRKILREALGERTAHDPIETWSTGYILRALPEQVDAENFQRLARQGEALLNRGDLAEGSRLVRQALALWRGDPLADVASGPVLTQHVRHLEELRMRTLQLRIDADMRMGLHCQISAELKRLVACHPLDEWLHGQLITALYRSGRRGDALHAYHDMRSLLREELGLDPSLELQTLYQAILSDKAGNRCFVRSPVAAADRLFAGEMHRAS